MLMSVQGGKCLMVFNLPAPQDKVCVMSNSADLCLCENSAGNLQLASGRPLSFS